MRNLIKNIFYKDLTHTHAFILTFILILIYSKYLFNSYFLAGHAWAFEDYDSSLHVASWWMYLHDEWRFPLLQSTKMNDVGGMNLAFTDGIPLIGLFFKLIKSSLPPHFHYFGYWYLFIYAMQAFASTYFLRVLGAKTAIAVVLGMVFSLTWPALVLRFGHAALSAQFLLILGMAIYIATKKNQITINKALILTSTLSVVALLIHPYLFPPLFAIYILVLIELFFKNNSIFNVIKYLLIYSILLVVVLNLLGYLSQDINSAGGGYGSIFKLDILTPFCGESKYIKCKYITGSISEWERTNYFGLGLLVLIPVAFFLIKNKIYNLINEYKFLLILLLGLTLYALSNKITINNLIIFSYETPNFLKTIYYSFRVAPRFFWMVGYFVLFITLATILKSKNNILMLLLLVAMVIQYNDLKPINKQLREVIAKQSEKNYPQYEKLMLHVDKLVAYPAYSCGRKNLPFFTHLQLVAGYFGKSLNSGYQARSSSPCKELHQPILNGVVVDKNLYILGGSDYGNYPFDDRISQLPPSYQNLFESGSCAVKIETMSFLCLKNSTPLFWNNVHPYIYPVVPSKIERSYYPIEMHHQVGQNSNKFIVASRTEKVGLLAGGPYYKFSKGNYEFTIHYSSEMSETEIVGDWSSSLYAEDNNQVLKQFSNGKLNGTKGQDATVIGNFTIENNENLGHYAINVFNHNAKQLTIKNFTVKKLNNN